VSARTNVKTFESASRTECLRAVREIWLGEGRLPQTLRHFFYALKARGIIKVLDHMPHSKLNAYKFTSRLLIEACKTGVLPWGAVIDTERGGRGYWPTSRSFASSVDRTGSGYTVDVWRGQQRRVGVWTEHKGLAASLYSVTQEYRIPVNVTKGYNSQAKVYEMAREYGNGKGWTLLYVGDFDATGLDIERVFEETLAEHGCYPEIVRVAITEEQIGELDETAREPVPSGDPRGAAYVARYGPYGYQVEAMRVSLLHAKLREAIKTYVDVDKLTAAVAIEQTARAYVDNLIEEALGNVVEEVMEDGALDIAYPMSVQHFYLGEGGEYPEPDDAAYSDPDYDDKGEDSEENDGEDDEDGTTDSPGVQAAWERYNETPVGSAEEAEAWENYLRLRYPGEIGEILAGDARARAAGIGNDDDEEDNDNDEE
jgi:hypothetical protein